MAMIRAFLPMADAVTIEDIYALFPASQAEAKGVDCYAYQRGLFAMRQTGETVAIGNDSAFQPLAW